MITWIDRMANISVSALRGLLRPQGAAGLPGRTGIRLGARLLCALAAMLCSAQAFAAVDLVLNHNDTGYDPVPAGGIVQYTLRVDNNGSTTATGVTLVDTLPAGLTFVSSTSTQGSCGAPAGGTLTCNLGSIAAGDDATVIVQLRSQNPGFITNTASATSTEADTNPANNLAIAQGTTINQGAELALSLTPSAVSIPSGGSLSYTLGVLNNGPNTATDIRVSGNLPLGFVVSGALPAGCSVSGQLLTCNLSGSLAAGASSSIGPINGVIAAGQGSTLTFAASVSVTSPLAPQDPDGTNNTQTVNTAVTAGSDLRITKSASVSSPVLTGTAFNYVLKPSYTGSNPTNLVVTDNVPANFQIQTGPAFNSNGWACSASGQAISCTRASGGAAPGNNVAIGNIVIPVIAQTAGNGVINEASIQGAEPDTNTANNIGQASLTVVVPTADLHAFKTGPSPALATAGSHWAWSIALRNDGPAGLSGQAIMTDTLPVGVTVHSYTQLNGWSCAPAAPFTVTAGNDTMTCTRDYTAGAPLASGSTAPKVIYDVSAAVDGNYNNSMCVSSATSGGNTPALDDNNANNCAGSGVGVQPSPDSANVQLFKSGSPASLFAGDELTYTLQIVNVGPSTSANVVLSDTFDNLINNTLNPATGGVKSITVSAGNSSGSTCTSTPGATRRALSCPFTSVPVCTKDVNCPVMTVVVRPGGDGGSRTNYADATSNTTADPDYSDNGSQATTTVVARADMTVTKTATPSPAVAGQTLTYVITARNNGPSKASAVSINDPLPLDLTFVSATASGGGTCPTQPAAESTTSAGNRQLTCSWASVGNGVEQTVTVKLRPNTGTRGTTLTNAVSVATTTDESDAGNNSASVDVPVSVPALDLLANITDTPDPVAVGDQVTYTLRGTNNGPSYAENVMLVDQLPATKLSFVSVTAPVGASCTGPAVGSFGGTVSCSMGTLAAGASTTVSVILQGEAKGTVNSTLTISSTESDAGFDTPMSNNVAVEPTTVRPKADVEVVSKVATPGTVGLREAFVYTIAVANNGPGVADGAALSDTLPAGMQLSGVPSVTPGNAADFPSLGSCTGAVGGTSFSCALGDDVATNATATINVPVIIITAPAGASPGTLNNTASISTTSRDEVPGNNSKTGPVQVQTATLAGRVYADNNGNGGVDVGEAGISGVTVKIAGTAADGVAVDFTTTTDASGNYSFTKLPAATYTVTETQPSAWLDGQDTAGSAGGIAAASPGDEITGVVLASNTAATGYNFGELAKGTIAGKVYRDLDNNGLVGGAGETGIASVSLTLTGTDDLGQPVTQTTTSDASGDYSFTTLRPGTYKVVETQPAAFLPGKATVGTGTNGAGTAATDGNDISGIVFVAGDRGIQFNFGELPPTGLSGMVYVDADRDGLHGAGETAGVAGTIITLSGTDDLGAAVNLSTTTDGSGLYSFESLRPGTYTIVETQPAQWDNGGTNVGTVGGSPRGNGSVSDTISSIVLAADEIGIDYDFGEKGQGLAGFVYVDLNGDGVRDLGEPGIAGVSLTVTNIATSVATTTTTDVSGAYQVNNLSAGSYSIVETQPTDYLDGAETVGSLGGVLSGTDKIDTIPLGVASMGTGYNFGELAAKLAGRVYIDSNKNGTSDAGEAGIAGVTLTLSGIDNHGNPVNAVVISDSNGQYVFTGLPPSDGSGYTVTETQPGAYADGAEKVGNLGGTAGAVGTSVISGIPVTAGANGSAYDFGELAGGISGVVFVDANNDGVQNAGETGIAGVSVLLTGADIDGKPVNLTVLTGSDGGYVFANLAKAGVAGYTITETQPATYLDGKAVRGLVDGSICSSCDVATVNRTSTIAFDPASIYTGFNFPELKGAALAGSVYDDINRNNVLDAGESLAAITITLTGVDDLGQSVTATTTTAADGSYRFDTLRPGTYIVTETQPADLGDIGTQVGNKGGTSDINAISAIVLSSASVGTGYDFLDRGGKLQGVVFVDRNGNGVQDAGEVGIAGVTVSLSGSASQTLVTDANGRYQFNGLRAGTYVITETQPAAYQDGGVKVGDQGGTAGTNTTTAITLPAGIDGSGYDFPELLGSSLRGQVYRDLDNNGVVGGTGETGIGGVTVTLTGTDDQGHSVTGSVVSDAAGNYEFNDLRPGKYDVVETQPNDYLPGKATPGEGTTTAGRAAADGNAIRGVVLAVGEQGTVFNFGELPLGSLAGRVYLDLNNDGLVQSGEVGIAGVTVTLTGTDDLGQPVNRSMTTSAGGEYRFDGLRPGNYKVLETQPTQYLPGKATPGTGVVTAGAAAADGNAIAGIELAAGEAGVEFNFGELSHGMLGGTVYRDLNRNGVPDGTGETGIAGVTMVLTGTDDLNQPVTLTVITDANGHYNFDNLRPGNYQVVETQPANFLPGQATPGTGTTSPGNAASDGNAIKNIVFGSGQVGRDFNFGEWLASDLSGTVFVDSNNDGMQGPGEKGIPGVTIHLTGTDADGNPVDRTVVTAADGSYEFHDLPKAGPGGYTLTETQPATYLDGKPIFGTIDGNPCTACNIGTINRSSSIPFDPAQTFAGFDFAELTVSSLSGSVYKDLNGNTQPDAGEGLPGVTVILVGTDDLVAPVSLTTTTAADGSYSFDNLRPGTYTVSEVQPPNYKDGGVQPGSVGGTPGTNLITAILLPGGTDATDYLFPELAGADGSIAGTVWLNDANGDPVQKDAGEQGLLGWTVELFKDGKRVPNVDSVSTGASGKYLIKDVPADSGYEVRFLSPNGIYYGYPVSHGPDDLANGTVDRNAALPAINGITVGSGSAVIGQDLPVDPSGVVYDSVTRKPLAGATVTLLDPSGQPVAPEYLAGGATNGSQVTGVDGYYQFLLLPGAPRGTYTLRIDAPTGYLPAPSGLHGPAGNVLSVPAGSTPYHVSNLSGPPGQGELPPYYLSFLVGPSSPGVTGNHLPLDPVQQGALLVRKTTPKINVTKGELVPYTIEISNTLNVSLENIGARDLVPAGFKYRSDSARVDGVPSEPVIKGRELSWPDLSFAPNQTHTVQLVLIIGSGVGEGEYVNQAWARNTLADLVVSNIATAPVRVVPDPTFDCADLIGKVFDDRNGNGYQDQGEPGLAAIRLVTPRGLLVTTDAQGRYHIPCAAMPERARGANFVVKLDERTLPTGYRLTTENPGDVRVTAGKMAKLNFGATIHRVLRVDVSAAAFTADGDTLKSEWAARLPALYQSLQGTPSLVRLAYHLSPGESHDRADARVRKLRRQITEDWNSQGRQYPLQVEQEIIEVQP